MAIISWALIASAAIAVDAFGGASLTSPIGVRPLPTSRARLASRVQAAESNDDSKQLLSLLSTGDGEEEADENTIKEEITSLESSFDSSADGVERFDPLIGLYEVKSVLTRDKRDNPVGGKWTRKNGLAQKLFRTRASFQHILPLNATGLSLYPENGVAEAINVVSLDALDGLLRISVILRGDAVPLSSEELAEMNTNRTITPLTNLAVRAYFDPPRIFFGKRKKGSDYSYLPLQLGPNSSVVLDATYCDALTRIGMGGTSGTRFVFARTDEEEEAKEYEALLKQPAYANKRKVLSRLAGVFAASLYVASGSVRANKLGLLASRAASFIANAKITAATLSAIKGVGMLTVPALRIAAGMTSIVTGLALLLVLFSTGGIERDGMSTQQTTLPEV
ncbi:hypothetical protein ACHAXT_004158 [Thalassiosira profunda]